MFELLPLGLLQNELHEETVASDERKENITVQLESKRPPNVKGNPTPEQIAKAHAAVLKAWKATLRDEAEIALATKLITVK
jgi:hypothetical protein